MPSKQVQAMTKEQCSTLQCHVMFLVPRPSGNPGALPRDFGIIVIIVIIIVNAIITIITIIIINTIIDVIFIKFTNAIIFISFWTAFCKTFSGIPSLTLFGIPNTYLVYVAIGGREIDRTKYGQVGYPWKDLAKCSSYALLLGQKYLPVKGYNQI